jgi:DinB superfamily
MTDAHAFHLARAIDVLRRTPDTLEALLQGIDGTWAGATEGPDTFSTFDVVGHLIDGEETDWIPRAMLIRARDDAPFTPYDRFRHRERNRGRTLDSLLEEFARLRATNLELLHSWHLSDAELDLCGEHPTLGAVTLRQLLSTWVAHDLGHIAQVARVMAKHYGNDVGPWKAFLPVLADRTQ